MALRTFKYGKHTQQLLNRRKAEKKRTEKEEEKRIRIDDGNRSHDYFPHSP